MSTIILNHSRPACAERSLERVDRCELARRSRSASLGMREQHFYAQVGTKVAVSRTLTYDSCMRANGISNMPEPNAKAR